jgi:hypothetical protein
MCDNRGRGARARQTRPRSTLAVPPSHALDSAEQLREITLKVTGLPVATERPTMFASLSRQLRPECLDPAQHGPVGHVDAPLSQQLHHAGTRERVAQVPTHGHQDHVCGPAIAREGGGGPNCEVPATVCAGETLATVWRSWPSRVTTICWQCGQVGMPPDATSTSQPRKLRSLDGGQVH